MDDLLFGLRTTVIGMGIVFAVLAILWALLLLIGRFDAWLPRLARRRGVSGGPGAADISTADADGPAPGSDPGSSAPAGVGAPVVRLVGAPDGLDPRLLAAITVTVLRHEEARRLQAAPAMRSYWPGSLLFASRWVAAGRTRQGQSWLRRR